MIDNVIVYLIDGKACDLVQYKKGFILIDSSTGEELDYNINKIESVEFKQEKNSKILYESEE